MKGTCKEQYLGDAAVLHLLEGLAAQISDGHFTIMKFTTGWRVSLSTPNSREDIATMHEGETLAEAFAKFARPLVAFTDNLQN